MSSQTVAQSASSVRALGNTTRTLNRIILDNEPKVGRIDDFAQTCFRAQWTGNREVRPSSAYALAFFLICTSVQEYVKIINASEASAIKLAATIKCRRMILGATHIRAYTLLCCRLPIAPRRRERSRCDRRPHRGTRRFEHRTWSLLSAHLSRPLIIFRARNSKASTLTRPPTSQR